MKESPNVLWIYGEDLGPDLGCYGAPLVQTPNIDRLAREGVRFPNAFVTCPVCSPSRSAIITGQYQTSFGAHHHRSKRDTPLPETLPLITDCFREAGAFTCNSPGPPYNRPGKTDFNFKADTPFDGIDWTERSPGQPFYAQINIPDTHRTFKKDPDNPIHPDRVELPPYYPDHSIARKDWALYLESIQILDQKVGDILARLEDEGLADNTLVFFHSDHGRAHIRGKQFLYDGGIHIPLIVRWPGTLDPGVCGDLVSAIDFAPTTLALAGLQPPASMEGQIFLGPNARKRDAIFSARDRCDGTCDRIRCVRTDRYKYIRNFFPERPYTQFNGYKKHQYPVLTLMEILNARGELTPEQARFMAPTRPAEELYDLRQDPHELHNLAAQPDPPDILAELRSRLDAWIRDTGDRGETPEDPHEVAAQIDSMAESYKQRMEALGLDPGLTPEEHLAYWKREMA